MLHSPRVERDRKVIAIGSGKGGVGKSSVAVNLAIALSQTGANVGLLDADLYGPSLPTMLGTRGAEMTLTNDKINPLRVHGIEMLSFGNLLPPEQAAIWRGPMLHQALQQLIEKVNWGELDYFLLDLPPGTGDVHLTMMQTLRVNGAVVVSTPQEVAIADVRRCIDMFQKINIPVIGMIENMAYFECNHGERSFLFGKEGTKRFAAERHIPLLGEIPLLPALMRASEEGRPYALDDEAKIFQKIAACIGDRSR